MDEAVEKFMAKRVRDFFEIQLIHDNDVLIQFLDLFDKRYGGHLRESDNSHIRIANDNA
jgi:hypothetical protein